MRRRLFNLLLLILSVVKLATAHSVDDCPKNVPRDGFLKVHGDSCFEFVLHRYREYFQAEADCESRGGTLALVKAKDIHDFLYSHLYHTYRYDYPVGAEVWIGLNDIAEEDVFVWQDGTQVTFTNWAVQQGPHNWGNYQVEDCISMNTYTGLWIDRPCTSLYFYGGPYPVSTHDGELPYICQYRVVTTTTTSTTKVTTATPTPTSSSTPPTAVSITSVSPGPFKFSPTAGTSTRSATSTTRVTTLAPTTSFSTKPTQPLTTTTQATVSLMSVLTTTAPLSQKTSAVASRTATTLPMQITARSPVLPIATLSPASPAATTDGTSTVVNTSTISAATTSCPPFRCALDCGMSGFQRVASTGCSICKCDI